MPTKSVEEAAKHAADKYIGQKNIIGTGVGKDNGESVVEIFVRKKDSEVVKKIPDKIDGYKTDIVETGGIKAYYQNKEF